MDPSREAPQDLSEDNPLWDLGSKRKGLTAVLLRGGGGRISPRIKVLPLGRELPAREGDALGDVLSRELGFELPCGGAGFCGGCSVRIIEGSVSEPSPEEVISGVLDRGMRLACRTRIEGDMVIELPELRPIAVVSGMMPKIRPDPTVNYLGGGSAQLGLAIDLGTTNIAGALLDLSTGETLSEGFVRNPQVSMGADIITRLERALRGGGEELRRLAMKGISDLIQKLPIQGEISSILIVGNSVMQALLLGLSVEGLSRAPFDPPLREWLICPAEELGFRWPRALAIIPPSIGGFAGSDALADVITTRLLGIRRPYLILDLGTNAQVILDTGSSVLVATAPAGSAFETSVFSGMGGLEGAVLEARLGDEGWSLRSSGRILGMAGSGLISAVAEMLRSGIIDESGRMRKDLGGRVTLLEDPKIEISQRDVREIQKGVASIYAAWRILVEEARVMPAAVVVAGTFGTFVSYRDALDIGLIPPVPEDGFISIGNAALSGAKSMLLSREAFELARSLLDDMIHVDLTGKHHFPDIFLEGLALRRRQPLSQLRDRLK